MRLRRKKRAIAIAAALTLFMGTAVAQALASSGSSGLMFSPSADLSSPSKLSHGTVPATGVIFLGGGSTTGLTSVDYYLDDPSGAKAPSKTLTTAPFSVPLAQLAPSGLAPGIHTLLAVLKSSTGKSHDLFARFLVGQAPTPTATTIPTGPVATVPVTTPITNAPTVPPTTPPTATTATGAPPALAITKVATLDQPTSFAQKDGDDAIYIAEKTGRVQAVRNGTATPVLDLTGEISDLAGEAGAERGLLGLAFAPNSSLFYVDYTNHDGDTVIAEYSLPATGTVDPASGRQLMDVPQGHSNHNGGQLAFGPDGYLYIAKGDGGSPGDSDGNGQNLDTVLGKILRIDPKASGTQPYTIPADNPFVSQSGARGEIWAYGLRNPWRFSFDAATSSIWIGDVGEDTYEEVDHANSTQGGVNYGWSAREGLHDFNGGAEPAGAVDPVAEFPHDAGHCSVTGGFVYRGTAIPGLVGRYLYGDFCSGDIYSLTPNGADYQNDTLNIKQPEINSFGLDHSGEMYVLSHDGTLGKITAG